MDELPHVEAAARGRSALFPLDTSPITHPPYVGTVSFSTLMTSAASLKQGIEQIKGEIKSLSRIPKLPPSDRFIPVMEAFLKGGAESTVKSIGKLAGRLDEELRDMVAYFGEDPMATKPEDIFTTIISFSSALQVGSPQFPCPSTY
jgi:hypothetical protein